jgi:hypothetical protein
MTDDALESVLRLVAEGHLSADEAGPILDALADWSAPSDADPRPSAAPATSPGGGPGRAIRLEVIDRGRAVVNLRVPLALGQAAIGRVPGITEATSQRIRDAIDAGIVGPILDVHEGSDEGVRIIIE